MKTNTADVINSSDTLATINHVLNRRNQTIQDLKEKVLAQFDAIFDEIERDTKMVKLIISFKARQILGKGDKELFRKLLRQKLEPSGSLQEVKESSKDLQAMNKRIRELYATKWWKKDTKEMMKLAANIIEAVIREYSDEEDNISTGSESVAVMDKRSKKKDRKEKWEDDERPKREDNFIDENDSYSLKIILTLFQSYLTFIADKTQKKSFRKLMKKSKHSQKWDLIYSVIPSVKKLFAKKLFMDALDAEFHDFFSDLQSIINSMDGYLMQIK